MKRSFFISLVGGLIPIAIFTVIAMTQLGRYSYTDFGKTVVFVQAGYVVLLIPAMIALFVLRKRDIGLGLLVSFCVGFFVSLITLGMGL